MNPRITRNVDVEYKTEIDLSSRLSPSGSVGPEGINIKG